MRKHKQVCLQWHTELKTCPNNRYSGLFVTDPEILDLATGRFTAPSDGVYIAAAEIRLDNADEGEEPYNIPYLSLRLGCTPKLYKNCRLGIVVLADFELSVPLQVGSQQPS